MDLTRAHARADHAWKRYETAMTIFGEACVSGTDDQLAHARRLLFRRRLMALMRDHYAGGRRFEGKSTP